MPLYGFIISGTDTWLTWIATKTMDDYELTLTLALRQLYRYLLRFNLKQPLR